MQATFRVVESENEPPMIDIGELFRPKVIQVRLYVLRAVGLQPKSRGAAADPYILVRLGTHSINDSRHRATKTSSPGGHPAVFGCVRHTTTTW